MVPRIGLLALCSGLIALQLGGCGGGGSGGSGSRSTPLLPSVGGVRLDDLTAYSSAPGAALNSPVEAAATSLHSIPLAGSTVAYTATVGHLIARDLRSNASEASIFYAAYTVAAPAASRPLVFFYNGGPGSATVWLHLGSFAPRRIVTNDPSLDVPQPYQLVDNAESLIDVADLVFVDAIGSGYSEAVAPKTNQAFWGVDADAAVMRDFIARYIEVNQRAASPVYILGESYGATRSAVLAELMLAAGMRLDGVVLQSSILDYNANCDIFAPAQVSCEGSVPSFGEAGAYYGLSRPVPPSADAFAETLRTFSASVYRPAVSAYIATHQAPPVGVVDQLVALTGAPAALWNANFDLDADRFRGGLLAGQLIGRYDARVHAPVNSAAAAGGDPSSTIIGAPFANGLKQLLAGELLYSASANYVLLGDAIETWDFHHDGRPLPDAVPDLAAALARKPALRVLSISGYHDLATPFRQTELDFSRLGVQPTVMLRIYAGGHMTYLDDTSRPLLKSALAAFVTGANVPAQASEPRRSENIATLPSSMPASTVQAGTVSSAPPQRRAMLAQGGDPYVPTQSRPSAQQASPAGPELAALVRRKIAAHDDNVYR